jgi:uncharacterized protein YecE (DUF72 family)
MGAESMDYLVGTGGWSYFNVENKPPLKAYSEVFNFVEVNYSFYEYPQIQQVEGWRRMVPKDFTFSVRCHQDLTHRIGLKPVDEAFEVFYKLKVYCSTLETPFLVLETPSSYVLNASGISEAKDFFASLNMGNLRLIWEYRAPFSIEVAKLMAEFDIVQCVDLSRHVPLLNSDLVYSRLFGKGKHNLYLFTDDELLEIQVNANDAKADTVILAYHGARMNTDAARFRMHQLTGKFPPVTSYFGAESAQAVLAEDAAFPTTKARLIDSQGWKVIDLTKDRRVHLSDVLELIPNKNYNNLSEVTEVLKAVL